MGFLAPLDQRPDHPAGPACRGAADARQRQHVDGRGTAARGCCCGRWRGVWSDAHKPRSGERGAGDADDG